MKSKVCPICGGKGTIRRETKDFSAKYALTEYITKVPVDVCSRCGAKFDLGTKSDTLKKQALVIARNNSVTNTLISLEKDCSFSEIERSFSLPAKTLSKWKNQSKSPSAAAAALVSLLSVFPWLAYVGMADYEPVTAYKLAGAAFFSKAAENDQIKTFMLSNERYDVMGIYKEKPVTQSYSVQEIPSSGNYSGVNK